MRKGDKQRSAHKAQRLRRKTLTQEKRSNLIDQARQRMERILKFDPTDLKSAFRAISNLKLTDTELKESGIGNMLKRGIDLNRNYSPMQIRRMAELYLR
jgi:hypothetical protein